MIPIYSQFQRHDPDKGVIGDCYRACIASLLELPRCDVPHFAARNGEVRGSDDTTAYAKGWVREKHGLHLFEITVGDSDTILPEMLGWAAQTLPDTHWILTGESKLGVGHCVVCCGGEIVHDPTYGETHGIVGPATNDDGETYFWCEVLVRP